MRDKVKKWLAVPPRLRTERLILRPMEEEDARAVVCWRNEPGALRMFGDQRPLTLEGHLQWFRSERKGRLDYILERAADGVGIGLINFRNLDFELGEGESGRLIGEPAFRGQGYAREAAVVWFRFGFLNLGLKRIVGVTRVENEANLALNRSLGYVEVAGAAAGFVKMVLTREAAEAAFGLVEVQVCD